MSDQDQKGREALQNIERELASSTPGTLESFDIAKSCDKYKKIKPQIQLALALVGNIPGIGKQIVMVLTFLIQVADQACPGS